MPMAHSSPIATHQSGAHETPLERRYANCTRAEVVRGARSEIRLVVFCHGPRRGREVTSFNLTRRAERTPYAPGIRWFTRHPKLSGAGAVRRQGRCRRGKSREFNCLFAADGPVSVRAAIKVHPGAECSTPVVIYTAVTTCNPSRRDHICPADLQVRDLWSGLPAGC